MTKAWAGLAGALGFLVVCAVVAAVLVLDRDRADSADADPGVAACRTMADDRRAGRTPTAEESARTIDQLRRSGNADLRHAAVLLAKNDVAAGLEAVTPLYDGCAALGEPLT